MMTMMMVTGRPTGGGSDEHRRGAEDEDKKLMDADDSNAAWPHLCRRRWECPRGG